MKKTYIAPETYIFKMCVVASPLAASDLETTRSTSNQEDNNFPTTITENSGGSDDSSYSNGQAGTGNPGNRAKMWDDTWDLPQWWNF